MHTVDSLHFTAGLLSFVTTHVTCVLIPFAVQYVDVCHLTSVSHAKSDSNLFTAVNPVLSMTVITVLRKYKTECKTKFKLNMLAAADHSGRAV
jgi:hypothetical protein